MKLMTDKTPAAPSDPRPVALSEPLEERVLLSHIVWTNRGSDGFGMFGTQTGAARQVVDAALNYWDQAISDFNQSFSRNRLDVEINMSSSGTGFGASANVTDADFWTEVPREGTITISRGNDTNGDGLGDGAGWFIDPTPNESSEFLGNIVNAFAGDAPSGSPAAGLNDLLTVVTIEMAHVLGLIGGRSNLAFPGSFATNTGVTDDAEGNGTGTFWAWDSPNVDVLLTSYDSGAGEWGSPVHIAGPRPGGAGLNFNGKTYFGVEDVGNASYEGSRRYLPSNVITALLVDAYGYTATLPSTFGTFYAHLSDTGELLIRGRDGGSNDVITLTHISGDRYRVEVDLGRPVPGTAPHNNSDTNPYITTFSVTDVSSIRIEGGDGNDQILLLDLEDNTPVRIDAGAGNDVISIGDGDLDTNIDGNVSIIGGAGDDLLNVFDQDDTANDSYTFGVRSLDKSSTTSTIRWANSVEELQLFASDASSFIHVNYAGGATRLNIHAGGGDDSVLFGDQDIDNRIFANVTLRGGAGDDFLSIRDNNDTGNDGYVLDGDRFFKTNRPDDVLRFFAFSRVNLQANPYDNDIAVNGVPGGMEFSVRSGAGNDTLTLGGGDIDTNIRGVFRLIDGPELLVFDDASDVGADSYRFNATIFSKTGVSGFDYTPAGAVELRANGAANTIDVEAIAAGVPVTLLGGSGDDTINVAPFGDLDNIAGNLFVGGSNGRDTLNIDDSRDFGSDSYTLTNNRLTKDAPGTFASLRFGTVEETILNANNDPNTIHVESVQNGNAVTVNAGDGDDTIALSPDAQIAGFALVGSLHLNGGAGADAVALHDEANAFDTDYVLSASGIDKPFGDLTFALTESLSMLLGEGDNALNVGNGDIDGLRNLSVAVNGGDGNDSLRLDDRNDTGNDQYLLTGSTFDKTLFGDLSYAAFEQVTLEANPGSNAITVESTAFLATTRINAGRGDDDIRVEGSGPFFATSVMLDAGPGADSLSVHSDLHESAGVTLASSQTLASLRLSAQLSSFPPEPTDVPGFSQVTLAPGADKVLEVDSLQVGTGTRLDLNDNALIYDYGSTSPLSGVQQAIRRGYNGGSWDGNGITTSMGDTNHFALGYGEASDVLGSGGGSFMGRPVDGTAVLVRYTRYGDADLDGTVSLADFLLLRANFGQGLP